MNKRIILIYLITLIMAACATKQPSTPEVGTDVVKENKEKEILKINKVKQEEFLVREKIYKRTSYYLPKKASKPKKIKYKKRKKKINKVSKNTKDKKSNRLRGPYKNNKKLHKFITKMVKKYKMKRSRLNYIFSNVKRDVRALKLMGVVNGVEKKRYYSASSWTRYRKLFITKKRIEKGLITYRKNKKYFDKAQKEFGVPVEYIVAILGIETNYGTITGGFSMLNALTSIAFEHPRRAKFFQGELENLLHMNLIQNKIPLTLKASYAGAFGYAQFMPSSFEEYAIDFNKDGKINFFGFPDTIGSIANYFKRFHWNKNIKVATKLKHDKKCRNNLKMGFKNKYFKEDLLNARIPVHKNHHFFEDRDRDKYSVIKLTKAKTDELWLVTNNFYVITRYNHSNYYAMAVHQLSQEIKKKLK